MIDLATEKIETQPERFVKPFLETTLSRGRNNHAKAPRRKAKSELNHKEHQGNKGYREKHWHK